MVHPKDYRLTGQGSFQSVFQRHKKFSDKALILRAHYPSGNQRQNKLGFLIRKKIGPAVLRNRIRRVLRECYLGNCFRFTSPSWVVFEVKPLDESFSFRKLRESANQLLLHV